MKKIIKYFHRLAIIAVLILIGIQSVKAQGTQDELFKKATNPIADLMSFPFQNNLNINYGPYNRNSDVLNFQLVIPFADGRIITRTIIPFVSIPDFSKETGTYASGISDVVVSAFYSPESKGLTWGVGPVLEIPLGGEKLGSQKWSVGPSYTILVQPGDWTFGALLNNAWSFGGNTDRNDVNHMLFNIFIVRQMGNGWYVNSAPIITADWTANSDSKWIVPLGGGDGKVVFLGGKTSSKSSNPIVL